MSGTARSGRRANPAAIRNLTGARTRPHHHDEPEYAAVAPTIPPHVEADPLAAEKWAVMVDRLSRVKVLTEAHGEMLALLCGAWADLIRAREELARMGYVQFIEEHRMTATGEEIITRKINPLFGRIEKLSYQVARFLGEFGLTPMTTTKVKPQNAGDDNVDPFDALVNGSH